MEDGIDMETGIDIENGNEEFFKNFLDSIGNDEEVDELNEKLIISFLEISEGNRKEEKLSIVEEQRRLKIRESARREKSRRDYIEEKNKWNEARKIEIERNRKIGLGILGKEERKRKKETLDEMIERLMASRMGYVE